MESSFTKDELRIAIQQRIIKAEEDWKAVTILIDKEDFPLGIVCFHCQQ